MLSVLEFMCHFISLLDYFNNKMIRIFFLQLILRILETQLCLNFSIPGRRSGLQLHKALIKIKEEGHRRGETDV